MVDHRINGDSSRYFWGDLFHLLWVVTRKGIRLGSFFYLFFSIKEYANQGQKQGGQSGKIDGSTSAPAAIANSRPQRILSSPFSYPIIGSSSWFFITSLNILIYIIQTQNPPDNISLISCYTPCTIHWAHTPYCTPPTARFVYLSNCIIFFSIN